MYLISAALPAIYRSLLDSDPAKITSAIIGYSDIRLFDLPVSIKQSKRTKEEGKLIIHSHKKKILADAAVRTLASLASFAEKSNCTAAKIELDRLWDS